MPVLFVLLSITYNSILVDEREIKRMMNDPDSYEHIETNWEDKGSYILLETSIRGTNPYGAKIVKTYRAKATIDGQILEIK